MSRNGWKDLESEGVKEEVGDIANKKTGRRMGVECKKYNFVTGILYSHCKSKKKDLSYFVIYVCTYLLTLFYILLMYSMTKGKVSFFKVVRHSGKN